MIHETFFKSWVPGVVLWASLNGASYWLASVATRIYWNGAHEHIVWEGAFEARVADGSAALRWHRIFWAIKVVGIALLLAVVWLASQELPFWKALYFAVLGSCTLPLCTTILRLLNSREAAAERTLLTAVGPAMLGACGGFSVPTVRNWRMCARSPPLGC